MKLHQASHDDTLLFTAYGEGYVAVNQQRHERNLLVQPQRLVDAWCSTSATTLGEADLVGLLAQLRDTPCEIVLLGTGSRLRFPPPAWLKPFAQTGIGVEVMDLQAACRTYNILAAEGRKVAAALLFD